MSITRELFPTGFVVVRNPTLTEVLIMHPELGEIVFDRYKVHISIYPELEVSVFFELKFQLEEILDNAVKNAVITSYKVAQDEIYDEWLSSSRIKSIPYTLYLHNEPSGENLKEVITLCKNIEKILATFPSGKKECMQPADIEIAPHLTFRQTALDGKIEYVSALSSTDDLIVATKNSYVFKSIFSALNPELSVALKSSTAETLLELKSSELKVETKLLPSAVIHSSSISTAKPIVADSRIAEKITHSVFSHASDDKKEEKLSPLGQKRRIV